MSRNDIIDLSKLPAPKAVEELSIDKILSRKISLAENELKEKIYPYDPIYKACEFSALTEFNLRARVNDAVKECLYSHATGTQLDNMVSFYEIERDTFESDEDLRKRGLLSFGQKSTAGTHEGYEFHIEEKESELISRQDPDDQKRIISGKNIYSPQESVVNIALRLNDKKYPDLLLVEQSSDENKKSSMNTLYLKDDDKTLVINEFQSYLQSPSVRPLTEKLDVSLSTPVDVSLDISLDLEKGSDPKTVILKIKNNLEKVIKKRINPGATADKALFYSALFIDGVYSVDLKLSKPAQDGTIEEFEKFTAGPSEHLNFILKEFKWQ